MSDQEALIKLPPELELQHPEAPWREGSYEHVNGSQYPDVEETLVAKKLRDKFPQEVLAFKGYRGDPSVLLRKENVIEVLTFLRDDVECQMQMLRDLFALDDLRTPSRLQEFKEVGFTEEVRFEVIYSLYSFRFRHAFRLRVPISLADCKVMSVHKVYKAANWYEREVWDMYGIDFVGHPNLVRILNHENFEGHPLRKDYPVRKRHNFTKPIEL